VREALVDAALLAVSVVVEAVLLRMGVVLLEAWWGLSMVKIPHMHPSAKYITQSSTTTTSRNHAVHHPGSHHIAQQYPFYI
jgi:hypothetical protein